MEEITRKVVSYCDIPDELTEHHWISEFRNDCYVEYEMQELEHLRGPMENWIWENYPELRGGVKFFINIDY